MTDGKKSCVRACAISLAPCLCFSAVSIVLTEDIRVASWYAAVLFILSHISAVDILTRKIRTWSVMLLLAASLPSLFLPFMPPLLERLLSLFAVSISAAAVILVSVNVFYIRRPIGGGDIRLMAVMSLLLGYGVIHAVAMACTVQLFVVGVSVIVRKKNFEGFAGTRTCFGPYLALGTAAVLLWMIA